MKYYVVADVHGYYAYLKEALEKAGFFEDTEPHKLILCGDMLDRGSQANQMIEFMLDLMEKDMLIYILGNHEDLMVQCLQEIEKGDVYHIAGGRSHHYLNGTWHSLLQIGKMSGISACNFPDQLLQRVVLSPYYRRLLPIGVDYYETPHYIFTHGWIPCHTEGYGRQAKYSFDPDWRKADESAWQKARWFNGMALACQHRVTEPGKTIVCGHWHTSFGHAQIHHACSERGEDAIFTPFYEDGIIAIDAATAVTERVNCLVIED